MEVSSSKRIKSVRKKTETVNELAGHLYFIVGASFLAIGATQINELYIFLGLYFLVIFAIHAIVDTFKDWNENRRKQK